MGATGMTGATGGGLAVFGGKYSDAPHTVSLIAGVKHQIELPTYMPSLNTTYTTANSITVSQAGTYEINYSFIASAGISTTLTLSIRRNGFDIPSTILSRLLLFGAEVCYTGSVIVSLTADDVLDMAVYTPVDVGVTLGSGVNSTLTIKRLD